MSSHKNLWILAAVLLVLAAAGTIIFCCAPQILGISEKNPDYGYESLFDTDSIMSVDITVDETEWDEMLANASSEEYIPCHVTINGTTVYNVGIRPKGNTSLSQVVSSDSDRYSFKIEFDHYQTGQTLNGLNKLVLNNTFSDATYIKEFVGYEIFNSVGVVTPLYCFANITVNGENWGLYFALEGMEESFAGRNYGLSYGQLYKPESTGGGGGGGQGGPGGGGFGGETFPDENMASMEAPVPDEIVADAASQVDNTEVETAYAADSEIASQMDSPEGIGSDDAMTSSSERSGFSGGGPGGGGMGGGMGGGGTDLVYTDDSADSYSTIFESAAFDLREEDQTDLINSLKALASGDYDEIEKYIDVDASLRYIAAQSFIINFDSYFGSMQHNYYLYEDDGKLTMLPWDLNLAFGGFSGGSADSAVNYPIDTPLSSGIEMEDRPLVGVLLANEEYLERYHMYLAEICANYIDSGLFTAQVSMLSDLLAPYVESDATAFYTYDEFVTGVDTLKTFVLLRAQSVQKQLAGEIPATEDERTDDGSYTLVDASTITLSDMGTQGGDGAGGKGSIGGQMGQFRERDRNMQPPDRNTDGSGGFGGPPPNMGYSEDGQQMPTFMPFDESSEDGSSDADTTSAGSGPGAGMGGGRQGGPGGGMGGSMGGPGENIGAEMQTVQTSIDWRVIALGAGTLVLGFLAVVFIRRRKMNNKW